MAFDPNLPLADSIVDSQVLRDQFNALHDYTLGVEMFAYHCAQDPVGVDPLALPISNPPTQAQVEALRDKINELLAALHE